MADPVAPAAAAAEVKSSDRADGACVARREDDVVVVVTSTLGQDDTNRLPEVGDSIQFPSGAVGHVVALGDLCFAAALGSPADDVQEGDSYQILPPSRRPTVLLPEREGALIDPYGLSLLEQPEAARTWQPRWLQRFLKRFRRRPQAEGEASVQWFQDIVGLVRRQRIDAPLHAGVMGLDGFVPIGRGQSMLLRLPPGISSEQMEEFFAHIVSAQGANDVRCITAAPSQADGERLQGLLRDAGVDERLIVVAGRSGKGSIGETILAMNAACALAEARRDSGGDSLLLLDVEPLARVWSVLQEVSTEQGLAEEANRSENQELNKLSKDVGSELWKYVARKNANTSRRRTFLGCFLQRAGRMAADKGGGSLTLLAFARLRDEAKQSRAEMELKLNNLRTMNLDEALRKKALAKLEQQIAELPEDYDLLGVPEDFIEEAKAVTDGHVVLSDYAPLSGGEPLWSVDLQESVARGITSESVQCRALHVLRSLNLKVYLMQREEGDEVIEREDDDLKFNSAPLLALMRQPVGDVFSVADEAALFMLAMDAAKRAMDARPLAEEALALLVRSKVSFDGEEVRKRLVLGTRRWAEGCFSKRTTSLADVGQAAIDRWMERLELKPLERKRVLATLADELDDPAAGVSVPTVSEDLGAWYAMLRARLGYAREAYPELMTQLAEAGLADSALEGRLAALHSKICQG